MPFLSSKTDHAIGKSRIVAFGSTKKYFCPERGQNVIDQKLGETHAYPTSLSYAYHKAKLACRLPFAEVEQDLTRCRKNNCFSFL